MADYYSEKSDNKFKKTMTYANITKAPISSSNTSKIPVSSSSVTKAPISSSNIVSSPHTFILDNRQVGTVSGVMDVISFNDKEILLKTVVGMMTIRGENMTLTRLDLERQETDVQGMIDSIIYSKNRGGKEYGKSKKSASGVGGYTGRAGWLEKFRSWW